MSLREIPTGPVTYKDGAWVSDGFPHNHPDEKTPTASALKDLQQKIIEQ